jgi:hypothetical protein
MSDEAPKTPAELVRQLAAFEAAMRDDIAARERHWEQETAETAARHKAEVARVQGNSDMTRVLHERSVAASERLAAAMERIAGSIGAGAGTGKP